MEHFFAVDKIPIDESAVEKVKQEYDQRMQELVAKYEEEQQSNAKLKDHISKLKFDFNNLKQNNDGGQIMDNEVVQKPDLVQIQTEVLERLQALEGQMVGGEKANDNELKEKRAKRKKIAEKKINAISEALAKLDNEDQLLVKAYGDITEDLRVRTLLLKRAKKKIQSLEQEINDLQSEFEADRTDYLETIRKQDQQIKLLSQIMDKIQPCLRKDCNYTNIDRVKSESVWDEDLQKWKLPDLVVTRTKLPPAQGGSQQDNEDHETNGIEVLDGSDLPEDKLFQKLEKGTNESLVANYFKPKRREQLLNNFLNVKKSKFLQHDQLKNIL